MKTELADPANWGLLVEDDGQTVVGFGGLLLFLASFCVLFAQLSCRMSFEGNFGIIRTDAESALVESAGRLYNLAIAVPAFITFTIWIFGRFETLSVLVGAAVWLGGANLVLRNADVVPVLGKKAHLAVTLRNARIAEARAGSRE